MSYAIARCADPARAAEIALLTHAAFTGLPIDPPSGVLRERVEDFVARVTSQTCFTAEADGDIIASVFCEEKDGTLYFGRLAVREDWRGRGVASALVDAVKAEARRRGLPAVTLNARILLPGNIRLFRRHGFEIVSEHHHEGYAEPTYVAMELRL